MNLLIVDDETYALEDLKALLEEVRPGNDITACLSAHAALGAIAETHFDIAFLDIELGVSNGLILAKQLKEIQPDIHIIFTTSYSHYAVDAFSLHATGYLLKPIQKEHITRELTFLYPPTSTDEKRLQVKTFGSFSVFADGKEVVFKRQKSKELFAFLVERNGQSVNIREACSILFEDRPYDRNLKSYFHTILTELKKTLSDIGADDVLVKSHNSLAIVPELLDCDYYKFLAGESHAVNSYYGEFMSCYSWAEFCTSKLNQKLYHT